MARTLWDALGEIEDGRGRKGRQYQLRSLLDIALAAMLAGANDLLAIHRWAGGCGPRRWRFSTSRTARYPATRRFIISFSRSTPTLSRVLGSYALDGATPGHIAIDGKTLKGSRRLDDKAIHVLSAFSTDLGAVIGDLVVEPDKNEITAALVLLKGLPLDCAIITGDAIFTQREICRHIRDKNGHYLFVVKDNQPALKADIAEAFGDHSPLGTDLDRQRSAA